MKFQIPTSHFPYRRQDRANVSRTTKNYQHAVTRKDRQIETQDRDNRDKKPSKLHTHQHHPSSTFWQTAREEAMAHRRFGKLVLVTTASAVLLFNMTPATAFASSGSKFGSAHHMPILVFPFKRPGLHPFTCNASEKHGFSTTLGLARGGAVAEAGLASKLASVTETPTSLFNTALVALAVAATVLKVMQRSSESGESSKAASEKPSSVKSLQIRFLSVFWLLRCADWLQGPYFYEVYASKVFNGVQASLGLVSQLFLTGFASTALFGPWVGRAADTYGRKKGTLAFAILYALGAFSTKSPLLAVLFLGRIASGIGTSLLFSAPESWLVGESQKSGDDPDGSYLGETFGMVSSISCVEGAVMPLTVTCSP